MIPALKSALHSHLFGSPGYSTDLVLLPYELELLRGWIKDRSLSHEDVRDKRNRLFTPNQVAIIKNFYFLDAVRYELGPFTLSDVVCGTTIEKGREEVYWRCVRPQEVGDVGPLHRDTDFHIKTPGLHAENETTLKAWIAVETEPGKNGLIVCPDSHKGYGRPEMPLELAPGEMVLFNENLLHRGMVNHGQRERVSVEITLCWK
jgi:hypothetical protein